MESVVSFLATRPHIFRAPNAKHFRIIKCAAVSYPKMERRFRLDRSPWARWFRLAFPFLSFNVKSCANWTVKFTNLPPIWGRGGFVWIALPWARWFRLAFPSIPRDRERAQIGKASFPFLSFNVKSCANRTVKFTNFPPIWGRGGFVLPSLSFPSLPF